MAMFRQTFAGPFVSRGERLPPGRPKQAILLSVGLGVANDEGSRGQMGRREKMDLEVKFPLTQGSTRSEKHGGWMIWEGRAPLSSHSRLQHSIWKAGASLAEFSVRHWLWNQVNRNLE